MTLDPPLAGPTRGDAAPPTAAGAPVLEAQGIAKSFAGTQALVDASLTLKAAEIHGLLGANGAGKSTLSRVISGHIARDAGTVRYRGRPLGLRSPREALAAGITIVMQETSLAPDLSVLENIFLPLLGQPGRLSYGTLRRRAEGVLAELGQEHALELDEEVRDLGAAQRQLVEIAKALALDAELIFLDEPTASLSPSEVERLFAIVAGLRAAGRTLVFVSHRLEEVFAITDRVTVLREGRTVAAAVPTVDLTQGELIRLMVGQEIGQVYATRPPATAAKGPPVLEVEGLQAPPAVKGVSFALHPGEILGLGGLVGAGRSETVETIFGLRPKAGGTMRFLGRPFAPRRPVDAIRAGIGLVAEDRRTQSIVPDFTVRENLLLGHLGAHRGFGLGYRRQRARVEELLRLLDLPPDRSLDADMLGFSGGMQQKIILARWLLLEPKLLLLDEPTKGVDIGTRASIYAMLRRIAAEGTAVLVVSSDFEELLGLCERVVVMSDGVSLADVPSALLDEEKLTLLAAPRSSMERNAELLRRLTADDGGAAFWALREGDQLFCLAAAIADPAADPGFAAGATPTLDATRIPTALAAGSSAFVREPESGLASLIVPVRSARGHGLGVIGLVLPPGAALPPAADVRARITDLVAQGA